MARDKFQDQQPQLVRERGQRVAVIQILLVHAQLGDEDGGDARLGRRRAPRVHGWVPEAAPRRLDGREGRQPSGQDGAALEDNARGRHAALDQRVRSEHAGQVRAVLEGARVAVLLVRCRDGAEGRGQDEAGDAVPGEGAGANLLQPVREMQGLDAAAPRKRVVVYADEARGEAQAGDAIAFVEGAVAHGFQPVWEVQGLDAAASPKRLGGDGSQPIGKVQGRDPGALAKREDAHGPDAGGEAHLGDVSKVRTAFDVDRALRYLQQHHVSGARHRCCLADADGQTGSKSASATAQRHTRLVVGGDARVEITAPNC